MDIRHKLYPYPVLSKFSDDYSNSSFETVVTPEKDGFNLKLNFLTEINNDGIKELIEDGLARIVYHLECSQTGFRIALKTEKSELLFPIDRKLVTGKLQVCSFIVAQKEIFGYLNKDFHEDYRGFKFDIDEGCILAIGGQTNIQFESSLNDIAYTPSVFTIIKNRNELQNEMIVDLNQNKIVIMLPEKEFNNYRSLRGQAFIQPVLNSIIIIPALSFALSEVAKRQTSERFEFDSYSWYRAIKKSLKNRFDCDIELDSFSEQNMLELAQKLIDAPLSDALQILTSGYTNVYEDEEGKI